jgi:hypothetical protein
MLCRLRTQNFRLKIIIKKHSFYNIKALYQRFTDERQLLKNGPLEVTF